MLIALKRIRAFYNLIKALYKIKGLILLFLLLLYIRVKSYKDLRRLYKRRELKGEGTYKRRL
jgi:hypothetical protein